MKNQSPAGLKQTGTNQVSYFTYVIMHAKQPSLLQMFEMIPFGWLPQCKQQGSVLYTAF